jgi:hypothetical protein
MLGLVTTVTVRPGARRLAAEFKYSHGKRAVSHDSDHDHTGNDRRWMITQSPRLSSIMKLDSANPVETRAGPLGVRQAAARTLNLNLKIYFAFGSSASTSTTLEQLSMTRLGRRRPRRGAAAAAAPRRPAGPGPLAGPRQLTTK